MRLLSGRAVVCAVLLWGGAAFPARVRAWSNVGHEVIATIAVSRLTPHARTAVTTLLAGDPAGTTLPAIATWADAIRAERPETERWHFVDIPIERQQFRRTADCREVPGKGDCVVAAVERERATLANLHRSRRARAEALKFVVHLIGDLHQPLHCAERGNDRGGHDVLVTFFGQPTGPSGEPWNLHAVWDGGLLFRAQPNGSVRAYSGRLNRWLKTQDEAVISAGTVIDWVNDAHRLARVNAYHGVSQVGAALAQPYYAATIPIVDAQLAKAGVRLARVLNEVFP